MLDFYQGIVNLGNARRFHQALSRAEAGEKITIAFIGGSITQGSLASLGENCYAYLVYRWFAQRFANVAYLNAGIGGTTSQFGAARVREDVLSRKPDVVFVEFSVNDDCTAHFQETYEGLIRQLLRSGAAVILIHNICYDTGASAEAVHLAVGKHYQLPCVSVRPTIYQSVSKGEIPARDITPDDLHPNDAGHRLLARQIICLLEKLTHIGEDAEIEIPEPFTPNHYENSFRLQNHNSDPVMNGFVPDPQPQTHITQMFRKGFLGRNIGDRITFTLDSTCIALQYRKSVRHPAPVAVAVIDGDEDNAVILDANFQETWGDCLYLQTLLEHGTKKCRTVEIRIVQAHEKDAVPFYLVSVIGSSPET